MPAINLDSLDLFIKKIFIDILIWDEKDEIFWQTASNILSFLHPFDNHLYKHLCEWCHIDTNEHHRSIETNTHIHMTSGYGR